MHLFHNWSKWSRPLTSEIKTKLQWRVCLKCGKAIYRSIPKGANMDDAIINGALDEVTQNKTI